LLALLVTLVGCRRQGGEARPDAGLKPVVEAAPDAGVLSVTSELLARFVAYQHALLPAYARLTHVTQQINDGGDALDLTDAGKQALLERLSASVTDWERARDEAGARAGISAAEAEAISGMVNDVVVQRRKRIALDDPALRRRLQAAAGALPAAEREPLAQALARVRQEEAAATGLEEERRRYGNANVDLLLAHGDELEALWADVLEAVRRAP